MVYIHGLDKTTSTNYLDYNCEICKEGYILLANYCYKESKICKNNSFWDKAY